MNLKPLKKLALLAILIAGFIAGCKKSDAVLTPPQEAHFAFRTLATYQITGPAVSYKLPVALTTVSNVDRTVKVSVTSPTGATLGTHYTLSKSDVVIPAGKSVDTIVVQGVFNQYQSGRKDTLVFTIQEGDGIKPLSSNTQFKLFMRGPCFEDETVLSEMVGTYANTIEDFGGPYGPYTTTISAATQLTPTTGEITVTNLFDFGWNPVKFILDWTDPSNTTVTLVQQSGIGNAGTISSAYAGQDISVRPFAGQTGTFSYCNKRLVLKMQLGVTGVGFFGTLYTVTMAR